MAPAPVVATASELRRLVTTATDGSIVNIQLVAGMRYELGGAPLTVEAGVVVRIKGGPGLPRPVLDGQHLSRIWLVDGTLSIDGVDHTGGMVRRRTRAHARSTVPHARVPALSPSPRGAGA